MRNEEGFRAEPPLIFRIFNGLREILSRSFFLTQRKPGTGTSPARVATNLAGAGVDGLVDPFCNNGNLPGRSRHRDVRHT